MNLTRHTPLGDSMVTTSHDAIIIGSGAGGAAAAYRLVRGGLRVLLLEKGTHLPTDGRTLDLRRVVHDGEFLSRETWTDGAGYSLTPEEHFNVGGKTKWYGAALARFAPEEFEADDAHRCRAWPISYPALERYYAEAEQILRIRAFGVERDLTRILSGLARPGGSWRHTPLPLGLDPAILNEPLEARHFDGFASAKGLKAEAESSFLAALRGEERLTLVTDAEVCALLGAAGSGTGARVITGVRLRDGGEYRSSKVFLAAGALHSPRLLERYVEAAALRDELPAAAHIGRNLKLHLLTAIVAASLPRITDVIRKTVLLTSVHHRHSSVQPLGFDAELMGSLLPRWLPARFRREFGTRAYGFFLQTEDGSSPDNRVRDARPGSPPVLDYADLRVAAARREHRQFTRSFQGALACVGLIAFSRRIGLRGTAHACGTLVCGSSPADSVVDPEGRVHGLEGLYVVDGSILPRSSRMNPALTIYAWALRVCDLLVRGARLAPLVTIACALLATHAAGAEEPSGCPIVASNNGARSTVAHSAGITAVASIGMTVSNIDRAVDFYTRVLEFRLDSERELFGEQYDRLFGLFGVRLRVARLRLGEESLELMEFRTPRGRRIPEDMHSNDRAFQHVAIVVSSIQAAYLRLQSFHVQQASSAPQRLPEWNKAAGGIEAFYFRDPDGHYLELIAFPADKGMLRWHAHDGALFLGIDHTAIVVAETDCSLHLYRDLLGLTVAGTSENFGAEQEHLNGVFGAHLRITALRAASGPGIELLEYLTPRTGRPTPTDTGADDLWYWQINLHGPDPTKFERGLRAAHVERLSAPVAAAAAGMPEFSAGVIVRDPDGHASLIEP
jgi:choline dehydrogenase-like flavoprotein/catechol 2,3-dioxygenase-like lactoylglutathione lyase family enzyme